MKITNLPIDKLNYLYNNYNYDNIIIRDSNYSKPFYLIPKELALGDIIVSDCNYCYLNEDGYIYSHHADRYMKLFTGLTPQEYFDILVLHINDTNDRPKCYCGTPIGWSGRIISGYGSSGHPWNESIKIFCSQQCSLNYRVDRTHTEYKNYHEFLDSGGAFGLEHNNPDLYDKVGFRDPATYHLTMMNKFINQGDESDQCDFYIATAGHQLKFGITYDLDQRYVFGNSFNGYSNIRSIFTSDRVTVAKLEYEVKRLLGFPRTEYMEFTPSNVIRLVNSIVSSIKLLAR